MKIPKGIGRWAIIVVGVTIAVVLLTGRSGFIALFQAYNTNKKMELQAEELQKNIDSLKIVIERLQTDTVYIERVAREKLGMAKKNERVYKFSE